MYEMHLALFLKAGCDRPQEQQEQDQPSSSTMVHPPTQDDEQVHQEEGHDQGGA
jgi:hypothetical protein